MCRQSGHSYRYLHGSLYYRSDNDTTYSQDPTYCSRYQNSTEAFWVYSSDGGAVQIYSTADEEYRDAAGNIYFLNAGNIYDCHDTDVEYSPDPNHWADAQDNAYPSFPVYGEDGSRASIHWSEGDAAYLDESGTTYDLVSGNLYSRNTDQLLFSPDQHYWDHANEDEDAPYAVGDAFRVYARDGSSVEIFERSDGKYADYRGYLYENTGGGLWYCDATNMEYSTDPNEWLDSDPDADGQDDGGTVEDSGQDDSGTVDDSGMGGQDYGENPDDSGVDGRDYGENPDDSGMDGRDYGENDDGSYE